MGRVQHDIDARGIGRWIEPAPAVAQLAAHEREQAKSPDLDPAFRHRAFVPHGFVATGP